MKVTSRWSALLFSTVFLLALQLVSTPAQAQSSYFTSRGCVDCHSAPTVATCAGCHQHSGTLTATKNKTTSYAPSETVTITLTASGARSGWIGARLYDQSGAEIARSTGNQSGMGGSTLYPAVLSAPAPAAAGTYAWRIAYFGNNNGTGTGDVHSEKSVNVSVVVAAAADTTLPVVSAFTLPATSTSLTVPVSTLTATDNVSVSGYLITTSATAPLASAAGWSVAKPTSVTAAAAGSVTFYAWAKDAAGNVSLAKSAAVVITLPDTTAPVVSVFTLPATSTSLTIPVSSFVASDNVGVTGYQITSSAVAPTIWSATAPTSVTAAAAGSVTFYAWAKDAAGNVSLSKSASIVITLPDTAAPVVSSFTLPATATSLTIPVSSFIATDNVGVSGYQITSSATAPTIWSATAPTSVTAPTDGNVTFYAWAKDAAGNVSLAKSASIVITLPVLDTTLPVVSAFTLPTTTTSLTIPVSSFIATDNVGVTGYQITSSAVAPTIWSATAPTTVIATVDGNVTFYAWAKDAAGNISLSKSATVGITLPVLDTTLPVVSAFTLPATSTSLTIPVSSFAATDNVGVTGYQITSNTVAPTNWNSVAPTSVTASSSGSATFYAWARDAAGNVSLRKSATVVITLPDTTAPVVSSFTLPATSSSLTVPVSSFVATDNVGVSGYRITSSTVAPTTWSATAPTSVTTSADGNVTFYAWARDAAGNVSLSKSASVTIDSTVDSISPELSISTLANDSFTNNDTLNVSGSASDARGLQSVTVNGQSVTINTDGTFSIALTLQIGSNSIEVVATDKAGNQTVISRTIKYDPAAPILAIAAPTDNSITTNSFITISGTVSEASTVTVTTNNTDTQYANLDGNAFSAVVYLVPGLNTIDITAVDPAGNISSAKRTVTYENDKPTLSITNPSQDITTDADSLVLRGTVADAQGKVTVRIAMGGKIYKPRVIKGTFAQKLTFRAIRQYAITVTARDSAGNKTTVVRNVIHVDDEHDDD